MNRCASTVWWLGKAVNCQLVEHNHNTYRHIGILNDGKIIHWNEFETSPEFVGQLHNYQMRNTHEQT